MAKSLTNRRLWLMNPKYCQSSLLLVGAGRFLTADIFSGSVEIPSAEINVRELWIHIWRLLVLIHCQLTSEKLFLNVDTACYSNVLEKI